MARARLDGCHYPALVVLSLQGGSGDRHGSGDSLATFAVTHGAPLREDHCSVNRRAALHLTSGKRRDQHHQDRETKQARNSH
ncbi:MAG TPA: hypothetical protein VFI72_10990 [Candidatus Angelobacter sp.]|nr:hypothetical protein [Candidatus Angelobacter sp.]